MKVEETKLDSTEEISEVKANDFYNLVKRYKSKNK